MADPTNYERSFDFSNYQAAKPKDPPPGAQLDIEFEGLQNSINTLVEAIRNIRRADGALKNGIVTVESLSQAVKDLSKPGKDGFTGWSPVLAVVPDGTRAVLQVVNWLGGTGEKPAFNGYLGPTGFVATKAAATDLRGPEGPQGVPGPPGADGEGGGTIIYVVPANAVLPTLSGTPTQGQTLTGGDGTWIGTPTPVLTRRWLRNGTAVVGRTGQTYLLGASDVGAKLRYEVTATNDAGAKTEVSSETATIAAAGAAVSPANTVLPSITGQPVVGQTLTGADGSWSGSTPMTFTRQWRRNGTAISGATNSAYTLVQADLGATITLAVTATNGAGASAPAVSAATAIVTAAGADNTIIPQLVTPASITGSTQKGGTLQLQPAVWSETAIPPTNNVMPSISGSLYVGQTLTGDDGQWSGTGTINLTRKWRRNGTAISGATALTYTLVAGDLGASITMETTATSQYGANSKVSNAIGPIENAPAIPSNVVPPSISGQPTVGQTLTVSDGSWTSSPTGYVRQWKNNGSNIPGATNPTYVVQASDETDTITCTVVAFNAAGSSAPSTTAGVGPVTAAVVGGPSTVNGLVVEGDSLMYGQNTTNGPISALYAAASGKPGVNRSNPGDLLTQMDAAYATDIAPYYNASTANTLLVEGGVNDLAASRTLANLQADVQSIAGKARATGFQVCVSTIARCATGTYITAPMQTVRTDYNTWLRANYTTFADYLLDLDNVPELSDPSNTTYFSGDGLHWTDASNLAVADAIVAALAGGSVSVPSGITFDPANKGSNILLSNGDRTATASGAGSTFGTARSSRGFTTEKVKVEFVASNVLSLNSGVGLCRSDFVLDDYLGNGAPSASIWFATGTIVNGGGLTVVNNPASYVGAIANGDVYGVHYDFGAGKAWISKNGVLFSGDPAAGTAPWITWTPGGEWFPAVWFANGEIVEFTIPDTEAYADAAGYTNLNAAVGAGAGGSWTPATMGALDRIRYDFVDTSKMTIEAFNGEDWVMSMQNQGSLGAALDLNALLQGGSTYHSPGKPGAGGIVYFEQRGVFAADGVTPWSSIFADGQTGLIYGIPNPENALVYFKMQQADGPRIGLEGNVHADWWGTTHEGWSANLATPKILTIQKDTANVRVYLNGALVHTAANTSTAGGGSTNFSLGGDIAFWDVAAVTGNEFFGTLRGAFGVADDASDATRQKFEGWLAWKMSAAGDGSFVTALPADHPYKSSAP